MGCTLMVVAIKSPCGCAVCCCCMLQFKNCKQDAIGAPQGQNPHIQNPDSLTTLDNMNSRDN